MAHVAAKNPPFAGSCRNPDSIRVFAPSAVVCLTCCRVSQSLRVSSLSDFSDHFLLRLNAPTFELSFQARAFELSFGGSLALRNVWEKNIPTVSGVFSHAEILGRGTR